MDLGRFSDTLAASVARAGSQVVHVLGAQPISGVHFGAGLVLSVAHALPDDEVQVSSADGRVFVGVVGGRDAVSDLALIQVPELPAPLNPLGTPAPGRLGELVLAVARPQPQRPQVSAGVLSDVGAPGTSSEWRTDARPFPGFSGGLLVTAEGAWLGVLNAGRRRGELRVLPAAEAERMAARLIGGERAPTGYLGAQCHAARLPAGSPRPWGLVVGRTEAGSPASGALLPGDVLMALDGEPLASASTLLSAVRGRPGGRLQLTVLRRGEALELSLTLGER